MKIKKVVICALALGVLAGCGDKEETKEEAVAIESSVQQEEVATSKEEPQTIMNEQPVQEEVADETKDPNFIPEYNQVIEPVTQTIQAGPGNNEEENYFNINGLIGDYKQIGDAFIVDHEYEPDKKILIIPVNVVNKFDKPSDISTLTIAEFNLIQEDDNSVYKCTQTGYLPDEYKNDYTVKIKIGGNLDYYMGFEFEHEDLDFKLVSGLGDHIVFANFINN
ncbi:hypothetical protein [uncultured Anaerococcus sp.]|uniref:hypothetical protein n=1 Tax=uncultured Anaerococcus sp. TaxID=293428 RepID=UPI00263599A0|nr:hypothetical protein [uncultured Anaerococcus sp.]